MDYLTNFSVKKLTSSKNMRLVAICLSMLIVLWVVMFAIPQMFVSLFDTLLGNLVLVGIIVLTGMFDVYIALGLAIVFMILFRFSHMKSVPYF
jgi:hypothetical protein